MKPRKAGKGGLRRLAGPAALLALLVLGVDAGSGTGWAAMMVGRRSIDSEVTHGYFGALRRDGRIMVNLVQGAAGKVYRAGSHTPVTLDGKQVGIKYLREGMPIALVLRHGVVTEIQVRKAGM